MWKLPQESRMKKLIIPICLAVLMAEPCVASDQADEETQPLPLNLSDVDRPPLVTKRVDPAYPFEAKRRRQEGDVLLQFIVTKEGKVAMPRVLRSVPTGLFDESALRAIRKWRFRPATKAGKAVDVSIIAPLRFELEGVEGTGYDTFEAIEKGVSHMGAGQFEQAIAELSRAISYFPNHPYNSVAYNHRGASYRAVGEYGKAIRDFGKALKLNPEQTVSYINRGDVHVILKDYQLAIDDYSAAIGLDPEIARAYASRGSAYRKIGKLHEAVEDCSKALSLDPDLVSAYYVRGNAHRELGHYELAVPDYNQVIREKPELVQAYSYRGYSYNKLGQVDKTCADFRKACDLGDCQGLELLRKQGACP